MRQPTTNIKYVFCKSKVDDIDDGKRKPYKSSYKKELISSNRALNINQFGFQSDSQGDKINHGGVDKAICDLTSKRA